MAKETKRVRDVEVLMIQRLRGNMDCHGLTGLTIAADEPGRWDVKALVRGKDMMPEACWDAARQILREISEQFDIAPGTKERKTKTELEAIIGKETGMNVIVMAVPEVGWSATALTPVHTGMEKEQARLERLLPSLRGRYDLKAD